MYEAAKCGIWSSFQVQISESNLKDNGDFNL